ncbi:MAG: hypothetical protein J2P13_11335 [Acidobacteria bacterium]|nr:hypothetical protein [Acidobacteriota bacterium]
MVSKCANPDCTAPFRYFHTGKLFRVETSSGLERRRAMGQSDEPRKPIRRLEFFWLCEDCASKMTLVFDRETGIGVRANDYVASAAA